MEQEHYYYQQHEPQHIMESRKHSLVSKIHRNVDTMLAGSQVVQDWQLNDQFMGIFKRDEIQLGKKLGSGGFSDVYACDGFYPYGRGYTPSQQTARFYIAQNAINTSDGESRYAIKHLKLQIKQQGSNKFAMAAADLVVEAQYLQSLNHPHILNIHGWAKEGAEAYDNGAHDGYFLIVDRLYETLDQKIEQWKQQQYEYELVHGAGAQDPKIVLERVRVASQIVSAMEYLHGRGIIYRDLKPNNIGFDINGDVKLFDFGLARELPESNGDMNDVYHMSGRIGTLRYMSPETAKSEHYNLKADVYSWSMVFYEMMALKKPFADFSRDAHKELVCELGNRPAMNDEWHFLIQDLLERSWSQDIKERPSMSVICSRLHDIQMDLEQAVFYEPAEPQQTEGQYDFEIPSDFKLYNTDEFGSSNDFTASTAQWSSTNSYTS